MKWTWVAVAIFGLLSPAQSAPVADCERLTQQVDIGKDQLLGKWTYIAEITDSPMLSVITKTLVDTVWWNVTETDTSDRLQITHYQKMTGRCASLKMITTVTNNTITMEFPYPSKTIRLSSSCPDCMVLHASSTLGLSTVRGAQLLSRRDAVSAEELEEFRKQAQCLNLGQPIVLDSKKGFCLDPPQSIDISDQVTKENMDHLESLIKSPELTDAFVDSVKKVVTMPTES